MVNYCYIVVVMEFEQVDGKLKLIASNQRTEGGYSEHMVLMDATAKTLARWAFSKTFGEPTWLQVSTMAEYLKVNELERSKDSLAPVVDNHELLAFKIALIGATLSTNEDYSGLAKSMLNQIDVECTVLLEASQIPDSPRYWG